MGVCVGVIGVIVSGLLVGGGIVGVVRGQFVDVLLDGAFVRGWSVGSVRVVTMSDGVGAACCEFAFLFSSLFPARGLEAKQLSDEPIVSVVVYVKLKL